MIFIAATLSYLIGSIPFAVIFTHRHGIDVRKVGSGNPGFANSVRAVGIVKALPVLVADIGKGWVGAYFALALGGGWWAAIFAVVGHCFSPWLKFNGGKGVATFIGVALFAIPLITMSGMLIWLLTFLIFRITSLASLLSIAIILIGVWWFMPTLLLEFSVVLTIILFKHLKNIYRISRGFEYKF